MAGLCRVSCAWRSLVRREIQLSLLGDALHYSYANAHDLEVLAYFVNCLLNSEPWNLSTRWQCSIDLHLLEEDFWLQGRSATNNRKLHLYMLWTVRSHIRRSRTSALEVGACAGDHPTDSPRFNQITEFWSQHRCKAAINERRFFYACFSDLQAEMASGWVIYSWSSSTISAPPRRIQYTSRLHQTACENTN